VGLYDLWEYLERQGAATVTDHAKLRELAEDLIRQRKENSWSNDCDLAFHAFDDVATPNAVLALLDEIDRLNAEWVAKCEELRAEVIEECAKVCDELSARSRGLPLTSEFVAQRIRSLAKKEGA
jgi:hypothetical protein